MKQVFYITDRHELRQSIAENVKPISFKMKEELEVILRNILKDKYGSDQK